MGGFGRTNDKMSHTSCIQPALETRPHCVVIACYTEPTDCLPEDLSRCWDPLYLRLNPRTNGQGSIDPLPMPPTSL